MRKNKGTGIGLGLGLEPRFILDGMMYVWWRAGELFALVFFWLLGLGCWRVKFWVLIMISA